METMTPSDNLRRRLAILDRIYDLYEEFLKSFNLAYELRCSSCCTGNLTMTTLEGYSILARAGNHKLNMLLENVRAVANSPWFKPQITINRIAELCRNGKPVLDEIIGPSWGTCPLLTDNACPIYPLRPFGCRCMVSNLDCRKTGHAQIDAFILTINNLFLQYIEHIDPYGDTGSLIDILIYFDQPTLLETFQRKMTITEYAGLALNRPIPALMVPPEHRHRVQPILQRLQLLDQT
ncbi:MAG: hypothetical protein JRE12_02165 [Deltaproteobacteria bacterium]|nr:hypothetical protein [Deltaproteobacteria bacterium]